MLNTVINILFKNFIALWLHLAKTQLLSFIHIVQIDLSIGWVSIPRRAIPRISIPRGSIPRISIQRKWPPKFSSIAGALRAPANIGPCGPSARRCDYTAALCSIFKKLTDSIRIISAESVGRPAMAHLTLAGRPFGDHMNCTPTTTR